MLLYIVIGIEEGLDQYQYVQKNYIDIDPIIGGTQALIADDRQFNK